jgi:hypothetical protein
VTLPKKCKDFRGNRGIGGGKYHEETGEKEEEIRKRYAKEERRR